MKCYIRKNEVSISFIKFKQKMIIWFLTPTLGVGNPKLNKQNLLCCKNKNVFQYTSPSFFGSIWNEREGRLSKSVWIKLSLKIIPWNVVDEKTMIVFA